MIFLSLQAFSNIQKIILTFLLPGHTMMPVDSLHAAVEHEVRNKTVSKLKLYKVIVLCHDDFCDWKAIQNRLLPQNKIVTTDGESVKFKDIRRLGFTKSLETISFLYDVEENAPVHEILKRHSRQTDEMSIPSLVYKSRLPLPEAKF
ncbi:hypothetical protein PR048_018195 [Dryococelus australis]|uniref:Uncharacterized protein n=1 Tax=Dryococelus australis TaxID=614101 RepID=A0ABQ9HBS5_9NEOP|nr:hypothetical protein PR048_018195 [Dryococelus australis]